MKKKVLLVFLILAYKLNAWQDLDIKQERLCYLVKEKKLQYTLHMEVTQVKLDEVVCYKITRTAKINQKNFQDEWLLEKPSMRLIQIKGKCDDTLIYHISRKENKLIIHQGDLSKEINISHHKEIFFPDTVLFVLRAFPFKEIKNKTITIFLEENKFLTGRVYLVGERVIETQAGSFPCYELVIKPQGIAGLFLKWSFWIYQREPFYLVKFEGYKDIFPPSKQIIELKEILK